MQSHTNGINMYGKINQNIKGEVLTRFLLCNINFGLETFPPFGPTILKPDLENKDCNYCNLSLFLLLFLFFLRKPTCFFISMSADGEIIVSL